MLPAKWTGSSVNLVFVVSFVVGLGWKVTAILRISPIVTWEISSTVWKLLHKASHNPCMTGFATTAKWQHKQFYNEIRWPSLLDFSAIQRNQGRNGFKENLETRQISNFVETWHLFAINADSPQAGVFGIFRKISENRFPLAVSLTVGIWNYILVKDVWSSCRDKSVYILHEIEVWKKSHKS